MKRLRLERLSDWGLAALEEFWLLKDPWRVWYPWVKILGLREKIIIEGWKLVQNSFRKLAAVGFPEFPRVGQFPNQGPLTHCHDFKKTFWVCRDLIVLNSPGWHKLCWACRQLVNWEFTRVVTFPLSLCTPAGPRLCHVQASPGQARRAAHGKCTGEGVIIRPCCPNEAH